MNIKTIEATILQGSLGDLCIDNLGWLPIEEQQKFWSNHENYVKKLKLDGEYLKPITINISFVPLEQFKDELVPKKESYRFIILDFSLNNVKD